MQILTSKKILEWELYTLKKSNITEFDLMQKAATLFANWVDKKFTKDGMTTAIICGWGNNGGDGWCIAEILRARNESVHVFELQANTQSELAQTAKNLYKGNSTLVQSETDLHSLAAYNLVVDAIFGIGINRPITNELEQLINYINTNAKHIMSVDIPSGVFPDKSTDSTSILADETMSFSLPKLSFFSSTNEKRLGKWIIQSINLVPSFLDTTNSLVTYVDRDYIQGKIKNRNSFTHKGTYGHVLLVGGSYGKAGSIILGAKAAYRSGAGLVTIGSCDMNRTICQSSLLEAMFLEMGDRSIDQFLFPENTYQAIGVGPGLGTTELTILSFAAFLESNTETLVLDADALNIIAKLQLQEKLIPGSILTPHPKEFDRLFGIHEDDFERRITQNTMSQELGIYIILKGAYTSITTPEGKLYYNSTGNPGMATGGSGDVLLGLICSFIAQGYDSETSCLLSVYIHGLSGDIAAKELGEMNMIASDIIDRFSISINMIK